MSSGADYFLKKALGEDFTEFLQKVELWKPGTRSTVDHEELRTALQIVPRTVLSLLVRELSPMANGETKDIFLPVAPDVKMNVTKHDRDVYSGEIFQDNKKVAEFKFRALPGVGLVIMSAFELYGMDNLINSPPKTDAEPQVHTHDYSDKIQKIIDERLALHDLVHKVVDKKILQRDAVNELLLMRLGEELRKEKEQHKNDVEFEKIKQQQIVKSAEKPKRPLAAFLEGRKKKKPQEFSIQLAKGECVTCPDCKKNIFDGSVFSGCICLGDDMERKVFIKKSEEGLKVRFSRGWDPENIEMLLEVLRRKNG